MIHTENCLLHQQELVISHEIHFRMTLFGWQTKFNGIALTKRCRPQFKELMHAQANDFHKRLVEDININRVKDLAMHEEVMKSGWLEDRLAILANYLIGLMQVRAFAKPERYLLHLFRVRIPSMIVFVKNTLVNAFVPALRHFLSLF